MHDTSRAWWVLVSALCWTLIHKLLQDSFGLLFVPKAVRHHILSHKRIDADLRVLSPANSTALLHSIIVGPPALIIGWRLVHTDPWEGQSETFDVVAIIMLGYFVWDVCVCLLQISHYGTAFLLHGILSLVGLYVQVASDRCRMLGFTALFAASELSTPFLHCRWYCIKAKQTHTTYFSIINLLFLFTFLSLRVFYLPLCVFPIYWYDCLYTHRHAYNMSAGRMYLQLFITIIWSLLNFYWAALLVGSQQKQWHVAHHPPTEGGELVATPTTKTKEETVGAEQQIGQKEANSDEDSEGYADPRALTRRWTERLCSSQSSND
eukprot:GHVS01094154.1.p1 GENE.GHVS01094154.1~~GHVS01094154.1.p1  ORF type:complete len:321 (+),score=34.59 GHVS01094154.1:355-1317(+)